MTELGREVRDIQTQIRASWMTKRATEIYDFFKEIGRIIVEKEIHSAGETTPLALALQELFFRERQLKITEARDPDIDTEFTVAILPTNFCPARFSRLGSTFCIPYAENEEFKNLWKKQDWIEEYPYWDNTDRPDNLTEEEWDQARKDWEEALCGWKPPSEVGYVYELASLERYPTLGNLTNDRKLTSVPSTIVRANAIASERVLRQLLKDMGKDIRTAKLSDLTKAIGLLKDPQFPWIQKIEALTQQIEPTLRPITYDLLVKETVIVSNPDKE